MDAHGVAEQQVARAAGQDRRREAVHVAIDRRQQRILEVVAVGVDTVPASQKPSRDTSTLSSLALVTKVSPTLVTSAMGVPGAIAPGIGSRCLAFSIVSSVSAPPAEVPNTAIFFGSVFLITRL